MRGIFQLVYHSGVMAGIFVLAVMVVRVFLHKAPRNMVCFLWILVGLRLLFPFSLESSFGIFPAKQVMMDSAERQDMAVIDRGFEETDRKVNRQTGTNDQLRGDKPDLFDLGGYVWFAGLVFLSGYFLWSGQKLRMKVKIAVPAQWEEEKIYLCDEIDTPFLMGIIHPRIYLPVTLEPEVIPYVVAHEKVHQGRRDHLAKWASCLLLIVYWFHPLIWIAYVLFSRDMEFACDEQVIRNMGEEHKVGYSKALLCCSLGGRSIFGHSTAFGEAGVKSRIRRVLYYKKPAFGVIVGAAGLIFLTAACFLTQRKEVPREGSVLYSEGCEFTLKEAIACKETDFLKLVVHVCSDESVSEGVEREYANLVSGGMAGRIESRDVGKDGIRITELGVYNQTIDNALTLWLGPGGTPIGTFSSDLVKYEQAEKYLVDSIIGKIRVLVSPHSMKIICEDGIPGKKEGGILAIEMKNGERWRVAEIPLRAGTSEADLEFDGELYFYTGGMDEENGYLFFGYEEPIRLKDIQSFVFLSKT